jgi:ubiquinone/menaquinone biosynthesis C-methylase UbiE
MTRLKANKRKTISAYNVIAEAYVQENNESDFWEKEFNLFLNLAKEKGLKTEGSQFLDLGCGTGRDATMALRAGFQYLGVDLSKGMLKVARKLNPKAAFREMDVVELKSPDIFFDFVWASAIFLHLDSLELKKALSEMKRVLKPNGLAFIAMEERQKGQQRINLKTSIKAGKSVERLFLLYTKPEFERVLSENGFRVLKTTKKKEFSGEKTWLCFYAKK